MAEPRPFVEGVIGDTVDITRPVVYFYHDIHTHTDLTVERVTWSLDYWRHLGSRAVERRGAGPAALSAELVRTLPLCTESEIRLYSSAFFLALILSCSADPCGCADPPLPSPVLPF